jgi:hypothetical protein
MRKLAAVIFGYVLWTIVWLVGNACLRGGGVLPADDAQPIHDAGPLLLMAGLGVICSVSAGCLAGAIAPSSSRSNLVILGILLFASGVYFELAGWNLTPIWYHGVFLGMLFPATFAGGRIRRRLGAGTKGGVPARAADH